MPDYTDEELKTLLDVKHPSAKPRPDFTDEDLDRMLSGVPTGPHTGPGDAESIARGALVKGVPGLAGLAGHAMDATTMVGGWLGVPGASDAPDMSTGLSENARVILEDMTPFLRPPTNQRGHTMEAVGEGLAYGAAAAPFAAIAGPGVALTETALAGLGGGIAEEVSAAMSGDRPLEERGIGANLGGMAADLAITAAAPAAIIAKGPRIAQRGKDVMAALASSPEVKAAAKRLGVSPMDIVRGSSEFKTRMPWHRSGDERFLDEAADALAEGRARFDPDSMPTTRQILEATDDGAGYGLANLEESLGKVPGSRFGPEVQGRRMAASRQFRGEYNDLRGTGEMADAQSAFDAVRDLRKSKANAAWDAIDPTNMPAVDTSRIKEGARRAKQAAGEDWQRDLPDEVLAVLEWPDEVPWERFQKMRSRALQSDRIGRKSIGESVSQRKAENLSPLLDSLNDELDVIADAVPESGYREALTLWRKFKQDFDPKLKVVQAFDKNTEGSRVVKDLLSSRSPAEDAAAAVRFVDQSPGGLDGLRRGLFDEIIGPDELTPTRAKSIMDRMRKHKSAAVEVWGEDVYNRMTDLMERARVSSVGKTGESAAAMSVGSGQSGAPIALINSAQIAEPQSLVMSTVRSAINALKDGDIPTTRVLYEAALDPELAETLLRMPTDRNLPAWQINWRKLVKRASLRTAARDSSDIGDQPKGVR